jgi:hypothetical protein
LGETSRRELEEQRLKSLVVERGRGRYQSAGGEGYGEVRRRTRNDELVVCGPVFTMSDMEWWYKLYMKCRGRVEWINCEERAPQDRDRRRYQYRQRRLCRG